MTRFALLSATWTLTHILVTTLVHGLRFDPFEIDYNLNQNRTAQSPLDYWGERQNHTYTISPPNWRFPFYTLFLDRFVNGDPQNDDANSTLFEYDLMSNQLRHGGDLKGLIDSLDYIHGMGIKGIYIAGSIFINQPWGADSYSPLDLTLLDKHFGDIAMWQNAIDEIHKRGMWVVLDQTMATMGDLIGPTDYLNQSAPFSVNEYKVEWKSSRKYLDFDIGNEYNETCEYPRFWDETGFPVAGNVTSQLKGCYNSDFDQYGDIEAFGVHPDWQRQLAKFASVQDRLREWKPSVMSRLERFSCMAIAMLDLDGFRIDKAVQVTVDAQAKYSTAIRECARRYNKENFIVVGEITSGNTLGSIYLGRGRQPDMANKLGLTQAMQLHPNSSSDSQYFLRDPGQTALDAGCFHYSIYRFMTRFLGLSGNLEAGYDLPLDWVDAWHTMLQTNDFYNPNNGNFDPRHLYGVTNQDVFRWPAIKYGTERMLLGYFITTLMLPGAPLVYYGEEQNMYVLDNTAENYVFGRQAFSPAQAWKAHGCYTGSNDVYKHWPVDKGRTGCLDESVSYDHRDPSAPIRNIMKHMFALREKLPVLEHGWLLEKLANQTKYILLNGSTTPTEFGVWSVVRGLYTAGGVQPGNETSVWLVYHNSENRTTYSFDCNSNANFTAFISPFDAGTKVTNLFSQDPAITLETSAKKNTYTGTGQAGCISSITLEPFEFRAYVPSAFSVETEPMITKFEPGHDYPNDSAGAGGKLNVGLHFSVEMDCDSITNAVTILTTTAAGTGNGTSATISKATCGPLPNYDKLSVTGAVSSVYYWNATLSNLEDGIHQLIVNNATAKSGARTNAIDRFLIRFGKKNNPIIFPSSANYSSSLVSTDGSGMYVNHAAPGATQWRYSSNWGSSWSPWIPYTGASKTTIVPQSWKGTHRQEWEGVHIMVQYYSAPLGSSAFIQHGDSGFGLERRFPHVFLHGPFNKWGFDAGIANTMSLVADSTWQMHFMYEWPAQFQVNIWGINPDSQPDVSFIYGDIDNDGILDRLPPSSLTQNVVNITGPPPLPALAYRIVLNDALGKIEALPYGHVWIQVLLSVLLGLVPVCLAALAGWIYVGSFYQVKINKSGISQKGWLPLKLSNLSSMTILNTEKPVEMRAITPTLALTPDASPMVRGNGSRRTVLIATMEYNIDDWNITIKIGGLGVMAKLMSSALPHLDVIWVVPCVGDVEYPIDQPAESMFVKTMGQNHEVQVQYHQYKNITYVLLDAPIFRAQTKADPYISRMDDIESAILYTAWNSCIAETIRRFPVDIYHINDYHGAAAPLYLLPQTIPCCLSLHNAEFQGMWPMRTPEEQKEVCDVFNLPADVVKEYVQYGSVFNLLHAGASYLRVHQRGFGAVGVSKKYGDRSLARYPIFWSLKNIGQLPNPDPSDKDEWDPKEDAASNLQNVKVDEAFEQGRADLRRQAQEWAGLEIDPNAELFVFVGRWSLQKGVDLIADIFPSILEKYPSVQLICVGPVIDLYGKFAALKLEKLVAKYPKRVFSKPEFTALPPYIFSGAEFALIPSRDEPFGLVAVEFGRKGALGVGARVGGLGQMPGFWYTIESTSPSHLLHQFKQAIVSALESKNEKRALMRAWSAKQRFPVAKWVQELDTLHGESIRIHNKEAGRRKRVASRNLMRPGLRASTATMNKNDVGLISPSGELPGIDTPGRAASPLLRFDSPGLATPSMPWTNIDSSPRSSIASSMALGHSARGSIVSVDSLAIRAQNAGPDSPGFGSPGLGLGLPLPGAHGFYQQQRNSSQLSLPDVVGDRHDLKLQKVDLFFTDNNGEFYSEFEEMLDGLTSKNSTTDLCIESFLKKSEKEWFARYRDAKLGRSRESSRTRSPIPSRPQSRNGEGRNSSIISRGRQRKRSVTPSGLASVYNMDSDPTPANSTMYLDDEFLLGDGYKAPTGLKKFLSIRVGDWPIYSFLLAFGQIISVNSYQIVLLTGETTQTPAKLYIVASTYLATSIMWWILVRNFKSVYALSAPWVFFGLAFLIIGLAPLIGDWRSRSVIQDIATAFYAAGASHGALAFALNFGDEGGAPTRQWITRALAVSGVAQVYSLALWYWGSLAGTSATSPDLFIGSSTIPKVLLICIPVAVLLWGVGAILFFGLPDYYRQSPETIPGFYISLFRRKIVSWFFVMIIIQNYWLSAPYGRNWAFLFSSQFIPGWAVFLLALGFSVGLWAIVLYGFSLLSESHTWLLPIFAIGLAAPRWAQMLWGVSGIGMYLPWAGSPLGGAVLSRCLWLWLGLLDAIQGVGLGMMLLATLTRTHVLAVLIGAQVVGSAFTMLAQATSPNALNANTTFPDFSQGLFPGIGQPWFWVCLLFQLIIPVGFFKFFRKEQVSKP